MLLLLVVAFFAGVLTVLSPCILPIVPIVLSAGLSGGRRRPLGVGLGMVISFTFSAALLASVVVATGLPAQAPRTVAIVAFLVLGSALLLPALRHRVELALAKARSLLPRSLASGRGTGFLGGVLFGLGTGVVCAPCAGPILTAVATLAATSRLSGGVVAVALCYALGLAVPLVGLSAGGRAVRLSARGVARVSPSIAGGLLVVTALALATGFDLRAQTWAANATDWTTKLQSIEQTPSVVVQLSKLRGDAGVENTAVPRLQNFGPASSLVGLTDWINSPPLTLASLRGKVVLVDFWTYSCVNCVREFPHVEAWYQRYAPDGFVAIGIHSPEFAFEHDPNNVRRAVESQHVTFPVALDNDFKTWNAFDNRAWPELYLIDSTGIIRYIHVGEGEYDTTEGAIRTLLAEAGRAPSGSTTTVSDTTPTSNSITPEMYLGAEKLTTLASMEDAKVGNPTVYSVPPNQIVGSVAFSGTWTLQPEYAESGAGSALVLRYYADRVYVVLSPTRPGAAARVTLDGKPIASALSGSDVRDGTLTIDSARLYELVDSRSTPAEHTLTVTFASAGVRAFSFTFG